MPGFLEYLATDLIRNYGDGLHRQYIIIPNLRPAIFLRKAIARQLEKPLASPKIVSIEEFVFQCTGLEKCSSTESLFRLHQSFIAKSKTPFTVEEFLGIGPTVLADFYEIDLYLANPKDLFNYLSDIRKIEQWAPDTPEGKSGEYAKKYLEFYASLYDIYTHYRQELINDNLADPALAFRTMAENRDEILPRFFAENPNSDLIFAGFNALTEAENTFMRFAKRMGKAHFYWDADGYYVDDFQQEAGMFFREMDEEILPSKTRNHFPKNIGKRPLHIQSIETTGNVQQVLLAAEKVQEWEREKTYQKEQVAIVLGDETLMPDLVQMLPREANVNLTLGMPLDKLQAGQLLYAATRAFKNPDKKAIYHRDLVRLLRHPFVSEWIASLGMANQRDDLLQAIVSENRIYAGSKFIARFFGKNQTLIDWLSVPKNNSEMLERVAWLFENLCDYWDKSRPAQQNYEREQTYAALHLVREAQEWVNRYFSDLSTKVLCELIWQLAKGETISFRGEPETGIQIMGILETRLLHFDQVVMLSLNEDVVPKGKSQYSLIPQDVKKHFNLPWFTQRDAIYAYHFYHLFHGCSSADLVYTQGGSGMGNAGKSRFLYQIEWEWAKFPAITFSKQLYFSPLPKEMEQQNFSIEKTPELIAQLEERFATNGISPSAIRSYLRDPMEFYQQYALGMRDEDLLADEEAGLPAIGIAVHSVLEDLYAPYVNQAFPDTDTLRSMQKIGVKNVRAALQKELGEAPLDLGKNIVALTAAEEMVYLGVQFDIDMGEANAHRMIVSLENGGEKIMYPLPIETPFGNIHLTGFIDRLEKWGDTYVYLDYKTGTVPNTLKWPEDPYAIEDEKRYDKLGAGLQILSYALLAGDQNKPFRGALVGLKKKSDGYKWIQNGKGQEHSPDDRKQFELFLCNLIEEILYNHDGFE